MRKKSFHNYTDTQCYNWNRQTYLIIMAGLSNFYYKNSKTKMFVCIFYSNYSTLNAYKELGKQNIQILCHATQWLMARGNIVAVAVSIEWK